MLRDNLYYIVQNEQNVYTIRFDASHPIFAGHFPGRPIVPGACLVQIAEELVSIPQKYPIHFVLLRNLRFNRPITPDQEVTITIKQTEERTYNFQFSIFTSVCAHFISEN